jgi:hypothetical protein
MIAVWEKSWWSPGPIYRSGDEWLLPRSQSLVLTVLLPLGPNQAPDFSPATLMVPNSSSPRLLLTILDWHHLLLERHGSS